MYSQEFLNKLTNQKNQVTYAKVILLNWAEEPIETIEGVISTGSLNIDGSSSLRHTCQFTLITQFGKDYNNYNIMIKRKFKLMIGLENQTNENIEENIIWFNQGIYLITQFSESLTNNNYTISINGQDKMCLINGTLGGNLNSKIDFGQYNEENEDGTYSIKKYKIKDIITNIMRGYAQEPMHNILINDLDINGLELLTYKSITPMYLLVSTDPSNKKYYVNFNENLIVQLPDGNNCKISDRNKIQYKNVYGKSILNDYTISLDNPTIVTIPDDNINNYHYNIIRFEYGDTVGYRPCDLIYDKELKANAGDTITSILDKISKMLINYEYFYNEEGQFIFQKKKSYIGTASDVMNNNGIILNSYVDDMLDTFKINNNEKLISISNSPDIKKIKNDFVIWGKKKTSNGIEIPILLRYSIDKKPTFYVSYIRDKNTNKIIFYTIDEKYIKNSKHLELIQEEFIVKLVDWREILFQMAFDFINYNIKNEYWAWIQIDYPDLKTGYEQYYSDIYEFWRDIYSIEDKNNNNNIQISSKIIEEKKIKNSTQLFFPQYFKKINYNNYTQLIEYLQNVDLSKIYINLYDKNILINFYDLFLQLDGCYQNITSTKDLYDNKESFTDETQHIYATTWDATEHTGKNFSKIDNENFQAILHTLIQKIIYDTKDSPIYYINYQNQLFYICYNRNNYIQYNYAFQNGTNFNQYETHYNSDITNTILSTFNKLLLLSSIILQPYYNGSFVEGSYASNADIYELQENQLISVEEINNNPIYAQNFNTDKLKIISLNQEGQFQSKQEIELSFLKHLKYNNIIEEYTDCTLSNYQYQKINIGNKGFNINYIQNPNQLKFWFDFIDSSYLNQYSVKEIGQRMKVLNDDSVKVIEYQQPPDFLFITYDQENLKENASGYSYITMPEENFNMFAISNQGVSAVNKIDELIDASFNQSSSITLSSIPLYNLQVNKKLELSYDNPNVKVEYLINKLSIPLNPQRGNMSITAQCLSVINSDRIIINNNNEFTIKQNKYNDKWSQDLQEDIPYEKDEDIPNNPWVENEHNLVFSPLVSENPLVNGTILQFIRMTNPKVEVNNNMLIF